MNHSILRKASVLVFAAGFALAAFAQEKAPQAPALAELGSRFARSTITAHDTNGAPPGMLFGVYGEWIVRGSPLVDVIAMAYGLPRFRIVDGPDWISNDGLYDIDAVPPPPELVKSDNMQMVRALLADRFRLVLEERSREMTVLALEVVAATPVFQATATPTMLKLLAGQPSGMALRGLNPSTPGELTALEAELTLQALAEVLTKELKRPVIDRTELAGIWTLRIERAMPPAGVGLEFAPLLESLGLTLTERRLPVDVLAITRIERPILDE